MRLRDYNVCGDKGQTRLVVGAIMKYGRNLFSVSNDK